MFAQRDVISVIRLSASTPEIVHLPISSLENVIAIEYDYLNNCVFWGDIDSDKVSVSMSYIRGATKEFPNLDGVLGKNPIHPFNLGKNGVRKAGHHPIFSRPKITSSPHVSLPRVPFFFSFTW